MDTFTWNPNRGMDTEVDLGIREVQFGNGVVQLQNKSLALPQRKFSLQFDRSTTVIDEIVAFLLDNQGKRFIWERPSGERVMVYCAEMRRTESGFPDSLRCTFKEVFI
ncbi:phage tail protein [Eikenella sp. HMSC061C02]|uniref:phage tail protein n=1 Tax=Eikenella sp. HMSC061C02 TaxID=1715021 RepID=UPI0009F4C7AD|nr:phage tail protein [Eikenella sp. HMSC061C02]